MTNDKFQMPNEERKKKVNGEQRNEVDEIKKAGNVIASIRENAKQSPKKKPDGEAASAENYGEPRQIEIDNLKNQLVRALADYQNQNKRFQEERAQIFQYAAQNVLENLLPILDILEKAQEHVQDQGLGMAIAEFKRVLKDEGLEEVRPNQNDPFDPELHEAVESVSDGEDGKIVETANSGWKFKDGKVIRYAKVKVGRGI